MKKLKFVLPLILVALLFPLSSFGQVIEIKPSYGYQFGAKLGYGPNYLKLDDSGQFGVTLGVEAANGLMAELTYINMSTELRIKDAFLGAPFETRLADLNVDWFLIGASKYLKTGKAKPFVGGGLGLVVVSPKNENRTIIDNGLSSTTKFAFNFKAGVNIMFSDAVGLNLQGDLFFPVDWAGVYVGTGGAGISTGSTIILGGFSAGLVFKIDKD
jgi:opacity protein-like surface antigen